MSFASIPLIGGTLERAHAGYVAWKFSPTRLIRSVFRGQSEVAVFVIGANDGPTGDPAFPLLRQNPGWRGTFVEPVPYLFDRLKQNYGASPRFSFVNAAVSTLPGTAPFFHVDPAARDADPTLPPWVEELGSFDRHHIASQLGGRLEPFIRQISVPTITLEDLFSRSPLQRADLLVIDTEGHDWEILKQLDLKRWRPRVIIYEHTSISEQDRSAARDFLAPHYTVRNIGKDDFCALRHGSPAR